MATRTRKTESGSDRAGAGGDALAREAPVFDERVTQMFGWPMEVWLRCQSGLLDVAQPAAAGWIERRRDAANAAIDTFEKLSRCSDLQEAASIHRAWFEGTMKQIDSELHAFADHAVALSREAMSATRYAARPAAGDRGRSATRAPEASAPEAPSHPEEPVERVA